MLIYIRKHFWLVKMSRLLGSRWGRHTALWRSQSEASQLSAMKIHLGSFKIFVFKFPLPHSFSSIFWRLLLSPTFLIKLLCITKKKLFLVRIYSETKGSQAKGYINSRTMDLFVGLWLHDQQTTERQKSSGLGYLKMPSSYESVFWKIIYLYLF